MIYMYLHVLKINLTSSIRMIVVFPSIPFRKSWYVFPGIVAVYRCRLRRNTNSVQNADKQLERKPKVEIYLSVTLPLLSIFCFATAAYIQRRYLVSQMRKITTKVVFFLKSPGKIIIKIVCIGISMRTNFPWQDYLGERQFICWKEHEH